MKIKMLDGEVWYGPSSHHGFKMPHDKASSYSVNIETSATCNQDNPLLLSNNGRIIYAPRGFSLNIENGIIDVTSNFGDIKFLDGFKTLRGAFLEASRRFFPPEGKIPPEEFFRKPQYNTWIELIYDQNQKDVLEYARGIKAAGMPTGILMIDDGWNDYYGCFRFSAEKFPDPYAMCCELHELGFKVMMWICPFVSPDSPEYRALLEEGLLICRPDGKPAVREWWNGWSAVLDMTNPRTEAWLDEKLHVLQNDLGIDGFKLDAGDAIYYFEDDVTFLPVTPAEHSELWNKYGLKYSYNEFRACFKCAGVPLVQRLHDKAHAWEGGVDSLVPNTAAQGILGYAYVCPDMIGGGSFTDFLPGSTTFDSELLIRYCAASALMPMMQFSLAPWRVLSEDEFNIILNFCALHNKFADKIISLAENASRTGEPIVRYVEYVFPHQGFEHVTDCFMLGDDVLVAPVSVKGSCEKTLILPEGTWLFCSGDENDPVMCSAGDLSLYGEERIYSGGKEVTVSAPVNALPYFIRIG